MSEGTDGEGDRVKGRKSPLIVEWKGQLPPPPIPNTNYAAFILNILARHGGRMALVDAGTGKHHTFSDLVELVRRVRVGLGEAGVAAGDVVLLLSPNHIDFPLVLLSVILHGAVCVPASPTLTPEELAHVVQTSGARWAVVHESLVGVLDRAKDKMASPLVHAWVLGHAHNGYTPLAQLMRTEGKLVDNTQDMDASKTVGMMLFSSGTTGLPKGVLLSHTNLLAGFMQSRYMREDLGGNTTPGVLEATLMVLPVCHIYGYNIMLNTLSAGGRVVMMSKFSVHPFFNAIQTHKITFVPIVPHLARYLSESDAWGQYDTSSLKAFTSGSAPIHSHTLQALMTKSGRGAGQGYGMTESVATIAVNGGPVGYKIHAVGRVLPYCQVKIIDVGTCETLCEGEEGEVCVRGPSVMMGYAGAENNTTSVLDGDGWLHTGDLGRLDSDGFLFLTDRLKDLIKVKGFQVSPSEVEAVLREVPGVVEVAVAGIPSDRLGEAPRAWVVPREGITIDPHHLQQYVAERMSSHKRLAGGVEIVTDLPKNSLGKVVRRKLRDAYRTATQSKL